MDNRSSLQETKHHGEVRFPFNIYPCTIPGDFRQVAVHWQDSMDRSSYDRHLRGGCPSCGRRP